MKRTILYFFQSVGVALNVFKCVHYDYYLTSGML